MFRGRVVEYTSAQRRRNDRCPSDTHTKKPSPHARFIRAKKAEASAAVPSTSAPVVRRTYLCGIDWSCPGKRFRCIWKTDKQSSRVQQNLRRPYYLANYLYKVWKTISKTGMCATVQRYIIYMCEPFLTGIKMKRRMHAQRGLICNFYFYRRDIADKKKLLCFRGRKKNCFKTSQVLTFETIRMAGCFQWALSTRQCAIS